MYVPLLLAKLALFPTYKFNALYINQLKMTEVSVETCLVISKVVVFLKINVFYDEMIVYSQHLQWLE